MGALWGPDVLTGAWTHLATGLFGPVLAAAFKGTVLLAGAAAAAYLLRSAPAAVRHLVWVSALLGLASLPLLSPLLPQWEVEGLPAMQISAHATEAPRSVAASPTSPAPASAPAPGAVPGVEVGLEEAGTWERLRTAVGRAGPVRLMALVWLAGMLVVLSGLAAGRARIWWLGRTARRVRAGPLVRTGRRLRREMGLRRPVVILRTPDRRVPMTWGVLRPRILVPEAADEWSEECRRNVLLHELAHVRRRDYCFQLLTRLVAAVFWFHPLVWIAVRRVRLEQERACDDYVLRSGVRPSEYARQLVGLARSLSSVRNPAHLGGVGASRSDFLRRMRSLLWAERRYRPVSTGGMIVPTAAVGGAALVLAALQPAPDPAAEGGGAPEPPAVSAEGVTASGGGGGEAAPTRGLPAGPVAVSRAGVPLPRINVPVPPEGAERAGSPSQSREPPPARPAGRTAEDSPRAGAEEPASDEGEADLRTAARQLSMVLPPGPEDGSAPDTGRAAPEEPSPGEPSCREPPLCSVEAVVTRLEAMGDGADRADFLRGLIHRGSPRSLALLMELSYRADRPADRHLAVRLLAEAEGSARYLYQVARANPWAPVRAEAIDGLLGVGSDRVVPWLVRVVYHDASRQVQRYAVGALARLDQRGAETGLMQIARSHPEADVRIEALYWLLRTGSAEALSKYVESA